MSAEATGWVFRHSPYDSVRFACHLAIADSVNDQHSHELWMSQGSLADKARCSRSSAKRALRQMVADGFLELLEDNHEEGKPNRYRFLFPTVDAVYDTRSRTPSTPAVKRVDSPDPDAGGVGQADPPPGSGVPTPGSRGPRGVGHGDLQVGHGDPHNPKEPKREPKPPPPRATRRLEPVDDDTGEAGGGGGEPWRMHPVVVAIAFRLDDLTRRRLLADEPDQLERLMAALDARTAAGWTPGRLAEQLLAGGLGTPNRPVTSPAAVLAYRASRLGEIGLPTTTDRDCPHCDGRGVVWADDHHAARCPACAPDPEAAHA